MVDAQPDGKYQAVPMEVPPDVQEQEEAEEDWIEAGDPGNGENPGDAEDRGNAEDQDDPPESPEPTEPMDILFRGFRTVSQVLSEAYGHAAGEIEILLWKNLATATHWDRNVVFGASCSIRVKPAMALSDQNAGEQTRLLAKALQAGKDALDQVMNYISKDENPATLTSVYPRTTTALTPALVIAWKYTDNALRNIHTQLSGLSRENIPPEQTGSFLSTVLELTCSFWHDMDNLATSQVLLLSKLVPNIWGGHRELLEGMSLMGPPSCSASWPASMVEWVTAVPAPKNLPGSCTTPTKSHSGAAKGKSESGKKQLTLEEASAEYWGSKDRGEEDEEARKQEEKHRKKSTGPVLSLADHEDVVDDLLKRHAPSRVTQPTGKASSSGAQDRAQARMKHPVPVESDNKPLSNEAEEPKSKSRKRNSPELIVIPEDDSPLLPAWPKATGKKRSSKVTNEEGLAMLNERLKAKVRAAQYNNELTALANYQNLKIHDLLGPPLIPPITPSTSRT